MIDATHSLLPLGDAAKHIPGRPHRATIERWRTRGVRGRRLETTLIGGRRYTSLEAIADFLRPWPEDQTPVPESDADRLRRARQAGSALQAVGS